jgi:hypothetical protein
MDNKALLKEIAKHATILDYHIKRLKKKPEQLHEIDVEVMSEKIKEIYTLVHSLETGEHKLKEKVLVVNEVEKVPMVKIEPEPEIPAPEAPKVSSEFEEGSAELPEIKEQPIPEPRPASRVPEDSSEFEEGSAELPESSNQEPVASYEEPVTTNEQPEAPTTPEPQPAPPEPRPTTPVPEVSSEFEERSLDMVENDTEHKTTADLFSGPTTIADSFQARDDNSIAATVSPHAVQDLKMAIGINDKFLFINELFKGDPSVYNDAIDKLNTVGEIQAADHAIEAFRNEYGWADNSEAYHRLKKIVKSKYNA